MYMHNTRVWRRKRERERESDRVDHERLGLPNTVAVVRLGRGEGCHGSRHLANQVRPPGPEKYVIGIGIGIGIGLGLGTGTVIGIGIGVGTYIDADTER